MLSISDSVIGLVSDCFQLAKPDFYFWGFTEYTGEEIRTLIMWLRVRVEGMRACALKDEFFFYLNDHFEFGCKEAIGPWQNFWPDIRDEIIETIEKVIYLANDALENDRAFVVFGV